MEGKVMGSAYLRRKIKSRRRIGFAEQLMNNFGNRLGCHLTCDS